ncbi:sensor histidine kinase [Aquabacterium sp. OR-4]|uniref:sensor histidine kinase n=1 Tax=Aquabacterium sp. OR-4 TaxID=2978127 RepID=UPI0021B1F73F|nr:ATP-binding protein [Aquabacterium sp. OR-4]MDT7836181.1 ATP-binding protein [Aquabacterium sp. OR-4]
MSRDHPAGEPPPGATPTPSASYALPMLPLALLACGLVAALLGSQQLLPGWLGALALLLSTAGALFSGACWGHQRQLERLRESRLHLQLLGQLLEQWQWQTDAEHRLVRLQPPQGAPASAWMQGAFSGELLWQRFDDPDHSLQPRLQAHAPLHELRVWQSGGAPGEPGRGWRLRGLPRFDGRGRFTGYLGVAEPTEAADAAAASRQALDSLLRDGPGAFWLLRQRSGAGPAPDPTAPDPQAPDAAALPAADAWQLVQASPEAWALMRLPGPATAPTAAPALGWQGLLLQLPEAMRERVLALAPGDSATVDGWVLRLIEHRPGPAQGSDTGMPARRLLCASRANDGSDLAQQALAAEHAAFSYSISHDLRAPIRVVEGFGRILKEDYGSAIDRIGNDHLDRVMAAAARMNHMIDALLALSKLSTQPLARQPVNLSQLAGFVADELHRAQPERQVLVSVAPGLQCSGDPTLLRMALENLLGNAWKYSAKVAQAEIVFERLQQGGRAVYVVRDNGAGFDMRFADRLFGVFQRLHSASDFAGHGVGLASVRRIVRRHGGEIWAESEVGQGARFFFTLKD